MNKILIVDDTEMNRLLLSEICGLLGHTSDVAVDGEEGYNMVANNNYKVIFVDVVMQKMSGIDMVKAILKNKPDFDGKIIYISALDVSAIDKEKFGEHDFIRKPIRVADIDILLKKYM